MTHRIISFLSLTFFALVFPLSALAAEPPNDAVKIETAEVSGEIKQNTIWPKTQSPIIVKGDITIDKDATLFIEPGVEIKMAANTAIIVNGTLVAEGKEGAKIVFTSGAAEPAAGNWKGIRFLKDSSGNLAYCGIEYAGYWDQVALICDGCNLKMKHTVVSECQGNGLNSRGGAKVDVADCSFTECSGTPIAVEDMNAIPTLGANKYEKNKDQRIWLKGGQLNTEQTLAAQDIPYHLIGHMTIEKPGKLTIEPGAVLKFEAQIQLIVSQEANLDAKGTKEAPIIFTAYTDDEALGDTNNDADKTKPAPDSWRNIIFLKGSNGTLENCIIRYGGYWEKKMLWIQGSSPTIKNCEISQSSGDGICMDSAASPDVEGCKMTKNVYPVRIDDPACAPTLKNNTISGNSFDAIWVNTGNELTSDMTLVDPGVPYHISGHLTVQKGATLTLGEAVVLKMQPQCVIDIKGNLKVNGTKDKPVYITAYADDGIGGDSNSDGDKTKPVVGYWRHIHFEKGSEASVENCVIRYACYWERTSIICSDCSPKFTNCVVSDGFDAAFNCSGTGTPVLDGVKVSGHKWPVTVNGLAAMPAITNSTFTETAEQIIKISGAAIEGEMTLKKMDFPYCFDESQLLKKGAKLAIEAGAVIKFRENQTFTVEGELQALGTEADPVVFTSYLDDTFLGDSNNDRGIVPANRGFWNLIRFSEGAKGVMKNCKVLYAGRNSPNAALLCVGSSPELENCEVAFTNGAGIRLEGQSVPVLTNCNFHHNIMPLYVANVDVFPKIEGGSFNKNRNDAVFIAQGKITKEVNWSQAFVPYLLDGDMSIDVGAKLTIAPGAVVKIRRDRNIAIQGTLEAIGTVEKDGKTEPAPIIITSEFDDSAGGDTNHDADATTPYRGAWRNISILKGSSVTMTNCVVRYGGRTDVAAISCIDAAPAFTKTTVEQSQGIAISFAGNSRAKLSECNFASNGFTLFFENVNVLPEITGCTFDKNNCNYLRMPAGKITEKIAWTKQPIPYVPDGSLTVDIGASLALEPGVVYKFLDNCELVVLGTLEAKGTADEKAYFTSISDDSIAGDSNADADFTKPAPNQWRGIRFNKGSNGVIENCVIRYCGGGKTAGIICDSASPAITSSEIGCCDRAITLLGSAAPRIGPGVKFTECLEFALWNDTANDIDATGNDWGTDKPEEIAKMIFDKADDPNKGAVKVSQ